MTTLALTLKGLVNGSFTNALDIETGISSINNSQSYTIADGTGANQANAVWSDTRTLSASASEEHDLAGGLTDIYGTTRTFTIIKAIFVSAAAANTNNVLVGGSASNAFVNWVESATDIVTVHPGGMMMVVAPDATGFAVTASTGDLLKVANSSSGTGVTYDIIIVGVA